MSFYDDASLVVIPSGFKTSKVYAEKPTDGSGDLAFTRTGDTATRVNSAGLIERVRTNLVLQSQTLSVGATWITYSGTTVTADAIAAPDGTLTADRIAGTSGAFRGIRQSITSSAVPHTFSVYLKSATGSATTARIWVDSGVTVVNVTTDWQRFSVTATTAASFDVQISTAVSSAIDVYAWGAMLETTDFGATPYIPTTTAAVSVGPVANVPRLDYLGSTCPRLLLEPQRTNLVTYSEQFDNAAWFKASASVTANTTTSPSGYNDADTISFNSIATAQVGKAQTFSSATYTISVWVRSSTGKKFRFKVWDGVTDDYTSDYTTTSNWQRFTHTFTKNIINWSIANQSTGGAGDIQVWGAQLEAGYATSYVPTLAASATRGADACSKTGISSLIGQTEGTLFVEFNVLNLNPANVSRIILSDGTTNNYIFLGINESGSGNLSRLYINNTAASFSLSLFSSTAITVGRHKLALAYKSGSFALYLDGNSVASSATSGTIPATSQLVIGGVTPSSVSNLETFTLLQTLLFKTRLTNTELATLTTL